MALKPKTQAAADKAAPATESKKFEGMEESGSDVAVAEAPVQEEAQGAAEQPAAETAAAEVEVAETAAETKAAPASESTAVAVAAPAAGNVVVTKKFAGALSEKQNALDPSQLDFNTFPRVTVGLDGFSNDSDIDLGKEIHIEVMSFNERFTLSPGVDDDDAKQHVRYSLNGKTIDENASDEFSGMDCLAYIELLKKTHGYDNAAMKKYLSVYGMMVYANDAPVPDEDQEIIALQVPPQSKPLFDRYQINQGVKIARGTAKANDVVVCKQEKVSGATRKYAQIKFTAAKASA